MPSTRELSRLFEAIADKNLDACNILARSITDEKVKKGHLAAAQQLRGALQGTGKKIARPVEPLTATVGRTPFLSKVLFQPSEVVRLKDVQLRENVRSALDQILAEVEKKPQLEAKGISRRNKVLFVGPPGCGKSMTARALASELNLPFYVVRLDAIIGAYLGQTANNLRELFAFASSEPCVLLMDEIDALGKQRGSAQDVGELDRIVIAMLQELEFFASDGLLIATSNLQRLLDVALWRRFDLVIRFPRPTRAELSRLAKRRCSVLGVPFSRNIKAKASAASNFAEASRLVEDAARSLVLGKINGSR